MQMINLKHKSQLVYSTGTISEIKSSKVSKTLQD